MGEYDAASVVAQLSDLTAPQDAVGPERLVQSFFGDGAPEAKEGMSVYRGFCGYRGGTGDSLETGFDEGYDYLGYLADRGWRPLPEKGNWPYVVYLLWPVRDGGSAAIAEYCEGDLTVWVFDTPDAAKRHYASLEDAP